MSASDRRVYESYIQATPEQIWQALTDPSLTEQYFFGTRVESDWGNGAPIRYRNAEGGVDADGEILEPSGTASKVTLTHAGFDFESPGSDQVHLGWVLTLSSLKTLLETGKPLNVGG